MFRFLKALSLTLALAAVTIFATSCGSSSNAQVRFVNAIQDSADYGNSGLDIEVNGTKVFTDVTFPNASASTYTKVSSGTDTFLGVQTGTTTQVFSDNTSLSGGKQYTLVATGLARSGVLFLSPIQDDNTAPATGNVEFRIINASPSSPVVDIWVEPNPFSGNLTPPATFPGVIYNSSTAVSGYVSLPYNSNASGYTVFVTSSGGGIQYFSQNINNPTGSIRTLVLTDTTNGTQMNQAFLELSDLN